MCRSEVFHFRPFAKIPLDRGDFGLAAAGDEKVIDVEGDDQDAGPLVTIVEARVARTACDIELLDQNVLEFCVPLARSLLLAVKRFLQFADHIGAVRSFEAIWDLHTNLFF